MGVLSKTKISLRLNSDWVELRTILGKPPIKAFIRGLCRADPDIVLVDHDETSCTFETIYGEGTNSVLRELVDLVLQDNLGLIEADGVSEVRIYNEDDEGQLASTNSQWQVELTFDDRWVLSRRNDEVLPVDDFLQRLKSALQAVSVEQQTLTSCCVRVPAKEQVVVEGKIREILSDMHAQEVSQIKVGVAQQVKCPEQTSDAPKTDAIVKPNIAVEKVEVKSLEKIEALIGAESFKQLAEELTAVAPQILRYETQDTFERRTYLFSIEDGCGLTTQLTLLSELLEELGILVLEKKVVECVADMKLTEMLDKAQDNHWGKNLVCFDLSEWMDKIRQPEFRSFIHKLRSMLGKGLFVFRIPFVDEQTRLKVWADLSDILTVQEVVVAPYTMEEFRSYAQQLLKAKGFTLEEAAFQRFEQRLINEKRDGHFYGLATVEKVVDELLYQKHLSVVRGSAQSLGDTIISRADVPKAPGAAIDLRPAMEQLEELIGIQPIINRIQEVLAQIEVANAVSSGLRPCLHMRFIGNPGTGKTTVARILGQLMKERGLLSKGRFFEYAGRDFCGQYIGETAPKTAAMCRDAYGSVLFVDEAYSLYRGDKDAKDYGREAIDTLIAQMENHRQDFMVIMAGYPDDMGTLMDANAGLASRMPYTISFPNYSRDDLLAIFMKMVKQSFAYEARLEEVAKAYFDNLSDQIISSKEFANARFVRNLFERTWGKGSVRRQLEPKQEFILLAADFEKATADQEFQELQKKTRRIGF